MVLFCLSSYLSPLSIRTASGSTRCGLHSYYFFPRRTLRSHGLRTGLSPSGGFLCCGSKWRLFRTRRHTNSPQHRIIARVTAAARTFLDFNFISFTSHSTQCVVFVCVCVTQQSRKTTRNQQPFGMDVSRTTLSIAAGVAGTLFLGYCIYFDKKRRSDPEYKKKIRERRFSNCVLCVQISINRLNNMRGCVCLRFYFHWHREAPATQNGRRIGSPVRHA